MQEKTALHLKYRPSLWDEVLGQEAVCKSLEQALAEKLGRSFLLVGPSGVGKTTIARLIASAVEANPDSPQHGGYIEVDGGSHTGVDDVRELLELIRYKPIHGNNRVLCLDEAHMLSKNAWNALLKAVEEPPEGVHWIFCTTEGNKVPKTIRTRCLEYSLSEVSSGDLLGLLDQVVHNEEFDLDDEVIELCVDKAQGSPREALTALASVSATGTVEEAEIILQEPGKNKDVIDLCRMLIGKPPWISAMGVVKKIENLNPEGVRNVVVAYYSKVAMGNRNVDFALDVLEAFRDPYPPGNSKHCLLLSLADVLRS